MHEASGEIFLRFFFVELKAQEKLLSSWKDFLMLIFFLSPQQSHYNLCATKIAQDQTVINTKIKDLDQDIGKLLSKMTERQKQCAAYADAFSRVRQISGQLSRCNTLLNQNIELMESLNNVLDVEDRLEPFVWTTN